MVTAIEPLLREQLLDRRQRLESAATISTGPTELTRLAARSGRGFASHGHRRLWAL